MEAPRKRALVGECISRAGVEAARGVAADEIGIALTACDYERAATIAFACAKGGQPVGSDVIGTILPGIELPAITCSLIAISPDRARLLDVLDAGRFPRTKDAGELEAIVLFAAWRAGADRARLIPHLRKLSARSLTAEGYALLATVAASYDDPNVGAATKPIAAFASTYAKNVATDEKAMTAPLEAVIAELPAEVEQSSAAGFTVRGAKQPGRNDPCSCGSGLKYKKCCADKPQAAPSPIPGLSWDDFLGAAADRMTAEHVEELGLKDLVRIDLTRVTDRVLREIQLRLLGAHEWHHAERVVAEAERRAYALLDDVRDFHVHGLLDAGRIAEARPHIAKLPPEIAKQYTVELAIADGPAEGYRALVEAVLEVVGSTDKLAGIDLAYSLLRAEPALGILAARACVGTLHVDDPEMMLDTVEEARDQLNLPPDDPAWAVLEELRADEDDEDGKATPRGEDTLKSALGESSARIDQLERSLAAMRGELDAARTRPAAELIRAPEAATGLEGKVRELEALIREGNAERRELRKKLETHETTAVEALGDDRRDGPRARRVTLDEADDDGDSLEPGNRELTIPRFERRFVDALGDVPAPVAAEAMRTVGTLAAGDGFAWRSVKQAKDMSRQVLMARVGIHHRMMFRVENGALEVLDLITREQLLTTLKRLRAKG
jgi:hypothetical protein